MSIRSGVFGFAVSCCVAALSANAADIYRPEGPGSLKDPVEPIAPRAGFYIGVNGGYAWQSGSKIIVYKDAFVPPPVLTTTSSKGFSEDGAFGGGQIGYNFSAVILSTV